MTASFRPFGVLHLAMIATLIAFIAGLVFLGRRWRGTRAGVLFERSIGVALFAFWLGYTIWDALGGHFDVRTSLPLELCDLVALVAAFSFFVKRRLLFALTYFWGLALSTQAVFTPDLTGGPGTLGFWAFWLYHAFVVGAGVYAVTVRGFRPMRSDLLAAAGIGVVWAVAFFLLDAVFDVNYGYLGRAHPGQPTILDWLGLWPWRVGVMVLLAVMAMILLWLPWSLTARNTKEDDAGLSGLADRSTPA